MNVGSLFSGIGGIELGFEREGFKTKWFVENNAYCQAVLRKHWPNVKIYGDITKINFKELEPVDVLTGGFPCQDISNAGKRKGITGEKSGLWKEYLRAISEIRPKIVFVENVSALTFRGLLEVLGDIAAVGYDAEWHCVPASAFGAPHRRDRIYILAYCNSWLYKRRGTIGKSGTEFEQWFFASEKESSASNFRGEIKRCCFVHGETKNMANSNNNKFWKPEQYESNERQPEKTFIGRSPYFSYSDHINDWQQLKKSMAEKNRRETWATDAGILRVANGIPKKLHVLVIDYEKTNSSTTSAQIDSINRETMRALWHERETTKTSSGLFLSGEGNYSLPNLPQELAPIARDLGKRIEKNQELFDLWQGICSKPLEETQHLQSNLLIGIRENQRLQAMATEKRVQRISGLGNAVVPQVAQFFARRIKKGFE